MNPEERSRGFTVPSARVCADRGGEVGAAAGGTADSNTAGPDDAVRGGANQKAAAYAAALACLPGAGPATLVALLQDWTPQEAWRRIRAGKILRPRSGRPGASQPGLGLSLSAFGATVSSGPHQAGVHRGAMESVPDRSWQETVGSLDPPAWWARHAARGIRVTWIGQPSYPAALIDDPEPVGVLFWRGSLRELERPCVAIVGTRRATPDGRSVAFEMAQGLAAAGVCVVSGLALGIDGAAHAGVLSCLPEVGDAGRDEAPWQGAGAPAPPAGVAASGVDVPYPRRHTRLWERVVASGVILSETPPGRPAQAWRFPARNRIIAALSRMVVVVESHHAGGSLITAEAAIFRGIDVRAVPGPVRSPASAGTNQLLHDGPAPVRNAQDVLDGLGIFLASRAAASRHAPSGGRVRESALSTQARSVLDAVLWRPSSLNQILERSRVSVAAAARSLDDLESGGWIQRAGDCWVRRAPPTPPP